MAKNIVYIQANEKIAQSFQDTFKERGIELIVAPSAEEALKIMKEQEIGLLLVDINIPDMRLSKLVEICSREFPTVIMNVCVDVLNSLLITKLVNRHAIHKIFVAPWDVKEMVEEIEESLDVSAISRDRILHEKSVLTRNEEFQDTLHSLTGALKKQQHSYGRIRTFSDLFFQYAMTLAGRNEAALSQMKLLFDTYLRMQTTDALDASNFSGTLASDIEKLSQNAPGFRSDAIECALPSPCSKAEIANIRFAIWVLAYHASLNSTQASVSISVKQQSDDTVAANVTISGREEKESPFSEQSLSEILKTITDDVSESVSEEGKAWSMFFHV